MADLGLEGRLGVCQEGNEGQSSKCKDRGDVSADVKEVCSGAWLGRVGESTSPELLVGRSAGGNRRHPGRASGPQSSGSGQIFRMEERPVF